jgi:bla regulator protein blaR1
LFAATAGLLTLLLRRNSARVRYWVWLAALVKFLVPFGVLVSFGGHLSMPGWKPEPPSIAQPAISYVMGDVGEVAPPALRSVPTDNHLPAILLGVWACGFSAILFRWMRRWMRVRADVHAAARLPVDIGIPALSSPVLREPGVFGVFHPVLVLPDGMAEHLSKAEWDAVLAHELCHVRCRGNFTAAISMFVESVFWFHPLVWWIGTRLVAERELACDEEVLRLGSEPKVYAEGILKICEWYLESPVECVAGVTGSNIGRRVRAIMTHRGTERMNIGQKLVLTAAGVAALAVPVITGMLNAPALRAQSPPAPPPKFEVASVKPSAPGLRPGGTYILPGGERYNGSDVPLWFLIQDAYRLHRDQITGGPDWFATDRFEVKAKAEKPSSLEDIRLMLQSLLADRFQLSFHFETVQRPVYALVVDKSGPKLTRHDAEFASEPFRWKDQTAAQQLHIEWHATSAPMSYLAWQLASIMNSPVIDRTGLQGSYDFDLAFTRDLPAGVAEGQLTRDGVPVDTTGETVFEAIRKLGLRLERQQGPVQFMRIDHVEKPSAN